jgi:hypothetical protein
MFYYFLINLLSGDVKRDIVKKKLKFYVVNAVEVGY